jgi:stage II sporulation protein P
VALSYALVALIGFTIVVVAGSPRPKTLPVTAPPAHLGPPGPLAHLLQSLAPKSVDSRSAADWLVEGAPLVAWVEGHLPNPWRVHWHAMAASALSTLTGTPLQSVPALLQNALPALAVVPTSAPERLPSALTEVDPGLPGDHGRVWAVLGSSPLIGIYQTHSHESFRPVLPPGTEQAYSTRWSDTVVQVGWWLAQDLHGYGFGVVQSRVDNMREGILGSWALSLQTAKQLLRWFPSVRLLVDVHRGQAPYQDTTAVVHGRETARILLVVGTNQLLPNPHWQENMEFALKLAQELKALAPGILRPPGVDVAPYRYNQQLLPADVLVEVGGPDNTLTEERRAVAELAAALAELIRARQVPGL